MTSRTTIVPILKFVGTVSLGLLTGVTYTTATQSIPSLLTLPSASTAQSTLTTAKRTTTRHLSALFAITVSCYTAAYALAPPRGGRHPYLLWTSLVSAIGWGGAEFLLRTDARNVKRAAAELNARREQSQREERDMSESYVDAGTSESVSDLRQKSTDDEEVNGEQVKKSMEQWRLAELVRTGTTGLAFCMAVLGIWGDGAGPRHMMRL